MPKPRPPGNFQMPEDAKEVFKGIRYKVFQWQQKQFDGTYTTYEEIGRNDSVIVIPVIEEEIVILKEMQPHWQGPALNLVAGGTEDGEDLESAARRELEEETGLVFEDFYLVDMEKAVAGLDWYLYTFVAKNLVETKEKKLDVSEQNEVLKVTTDELVKMTRDRTLLHRARLIEKYIIQDKLADFYDLLKNPEKYQIKY